MAGYAEINECPNCGEMSFGQNMESHEPSAYTGNCWNCGYHQYVIDSQMTLKQLNCYRLDKLPPDGEPKEPLTELPACDFPLQREIKEAEKAPPSVG